MDRIDSYRQIIEKIFSEYMEIPYKYGEIRNEIIISQDSNRYLLLMTGWREDQRIYGCLTHIDIINGKLWIQHDNTEQGVAEDLERYGVKKEDIVLGFHPPDVRPYTGYATG